MKHGKKATGGRYHASRKRRKYELSGIVRVVTLKQRKMKSRAKVISQKHIRSIPPFCDNPISSEELHRRELVKEGKIIITKPSPRRVEKQIKNK